MQNKNGYGASAHMNTLRNRVYCMLLIALAILTACHKDSPEEMVRLLVLEVQKGVESKDVNRVLSAVSVNYRDSQGNDREALKGLILYYFLQHQEIGVLLTDMDISVDGSTAVARFQAVLTARSDETAVLPDALDAYRFEISLTIESGRWKVTSARWHRIGEHSRTGAGNAVSGLLTS